MSWVAASIGAVGAGMSIAGAAGVGGPGQPSRPRSPGMQTLEQLGTFAPTMSDLAMRQQLGEGSGAAKTEQWNRRKLESKARQMLKSKVPAEREQGGILMKLAQDARRTGKAQTVNLDASGNVILGGDYTGFGTADIQGELAGKFADIDRELSEKYGTQFAEEQAKLAELANPEGTGARNLQYEMLQQELANPRPINPLAQTLDDDIDAQLRAGRGFDPQARASLDAAVADANAARGGRLSADDVATSLSTGNEGQRRLQAAQDKAGAWVSSGQDPATQRYNRTQANIDAMQRFVGGRNPTDEYAMLAGSNRGAAPITTGTLPGIPNDAAAQGTQYANNVYNQQVQQALGQTSWLTGFGNALMQGASLATAKK